MYGRNGKRTPAVAAVMTEKLVAGYNLEEGCGLKAAKRIKPVHRIGKRRLASREFNGESVE
jgi:hypothetical protein